MGRTADTRETTILFGLLAGSAGPLAAQEAPGAGAAPGARPVERKAAMAAKLAGLVAPSFIVKH